MTPSREYSISVQQVEPRTIAAVHARVPFGGVPGVFRKYLDQVYAAGRDGAVRLDGQNVFVYQPARDEPNKLDVAFGVGVTEPFSAVGAVVPTSLPLGEAVTATHWGSYAGLRGAHDAIQEWIRQSGRRNAGPSWEVYGHWTGDESKLRTDIFYLLEPR